MPGVELTDDTFTVSQSWLSTFLRCPAEAGFELRGETPYSSTDATELGSAWHEYCEARGWGRDVEDSTAIACEYLEGAVKEPYFEYVQTKTLDTLLAHLMVLVDTYEDQVHPKLGSALGLEESFDVPLVRAADDTVIRLKGTMDRHDSLLGLLDWKTAGRTGKGSVWDEHVVKFKIQADAYTYAHAYSVVDNPFTDLMELPFTFVVATKGPRQSAVEWHTVKKTPTDWAWLQQVALNALQCARADVWPVNHTSHLCSPKWCANWDMCRGATQAQPVPLLPTQTTNLLSLI